MQVGGGGECKWMLESEAVRMGVSMLMCDVLCVDAWKDEMQA